MRNSLDLSLYLITDRKLARGRKLESVVQDAIEGGVTAIQLREKKCSSREFLQIALSLLNITREARIPLIINDRVDIALACGADGVHLGQDDMPHEKAREMLGPRAIIGLSVTNLDQARQAEKWDLDYLGIGPIFFTETKEDLKTPIGFEGLKNIASVSSHKLVAIGGIKSDTAPQALQCGAAGIAVVSAIMAADDPKEASQKLLNAVHSAK